MKITQLSFVNIRNHSITRFAPNPDINIFTGLNGQGKTSVLEALSIATITRPFTDAMEQNIVSKGEKNCEIEIEFITDLLVKRRIKVRYEIGVGKTIWLDNEKINSSANIIGIAPTVFLSPDLKIITSGSPGDRRRFIDIVISQAKRKYLETLIDYRKSLKQRNALLSDSVKQKRNIPESLLEPYNEILIELSAKLMQERNDFLLELEPIFKSKVKELTQNIDEAELKYLPNSAGKALSCISDYRDALWLKSKQVKHEELKRGQTLIGAHKDELKIKLNGLEARIAASQGQHKTLLTSLKIAEFQYLVSKHKETPIILLDDIFSELDEHRAKKVFEATNSLAQIFISTVALKNIFLSENDNFSLFEISNGAIGKPTTSSNENMLENSLLEN